jgi:hypothetical protein
LKLHETTKEKLAKIWTFQENPWRKKEKVWRRSGDFDPAPPARAAPREDHDYHGALTARTRGAP